MKLGRQLLALLALCYAVCCSAIDGAAAAAVAAAVNATEAPTAVAANTTELPTAGASRNSAKPINSSITATTNSNNTAPDPLPNQVAMPQFAEASGVPYIRSATLHITCATDGAVISYTTDGTEPVPGVAEELAKDESSVFIDEPGEWHVQAVGSKPGMQNSAVAEFTVLVQEQTALPQIVLTGTYHQQRVQCQLGFLT
jgi:Chitobiase/beta-hexosaminidase C-terminal domain